MHSKGRCVTERSLAFETEAVWVQYRKVILQLLPAAEAFHVASFAAQTMPLLVMVSQVSSQFHGEGNDFLAAAMLVIAHGLEFVVRHHVRIHIADLGTVSPDLSA